MNAIFINSGLLGHKTIARILAHCMHGDSTFDAHHIDLSSGLSIYDRLVRRMWCIRPPEVLRFGSNWDFARWRQEYSVGLLAARRIRSLERQGMHPDILHFHTQPCAYASIRRMKRTPSIVSIDCTQRLAALHASRFEKFTYSPNRIWDDVVFRAAAAIVSTSQWAADDLIDGCPAVRKKVFVLPWPVKIEEFDPAWIDERYQRALNANPQAKPRMLFVGADFVRKGGPELLRAWEEGGFSNAWELELATTLPGGVALPAGVRLLPAVQAYTPQWRDMWRRADIFVMPTTGEAFGIVFQEAAAAGLPCIGTRLNAIPEIVIDGKTGILVPAFEIAPLVSAMRELMASADMRRSMGLAGRARIEERAKPSVYGSGLQSIMKEAIAARQS